MTWTDGAGVVVVNMKGGPGGEPGGRGNLEESR